MSTMTSTQKIDGRQIAREIKKTVAKEAAALREAGHPPRLDVVLVGEDGPSVRYVKRKGKAAHACGIDFELHHLPASTSQESLLKKIAEIQNNPALSGLIVQLPLPQHISRSAVLNAIDPTVDVDCLTPTNFGRLAEQDQQLLPPTAGGIVAMLRSIGVSLSGANIAIVGTGLLVGMPLSIILKAQGATVGACNTRTENNAQTCARADVLISAVGKRDLISADMIKPGAIVIDAGIDVVDGKVYGDVNKKAARERASKLTPTIGGVGPVTVAMLLHNVIVCAKRKEQLRKKK